MPQTCRVCAHPKTKQIEDAIIQGIAHTTIADNFGIHHQSVRYHSEHHLSDKLVKAFKRNDQEHAEDILSGIKDLLSRTNAILDEAEANNQKRLALDAIKEARSTYELLSKIAVKLEEYRRNEDQQNTDLLEQHLLIGMNALTDNELKTLIDLTGKIHAADPDYEMNSTSRFAVEAMNRLNDYSEDFGTSSNHSDSDYDDNTAPEDKNTFKNRTDDEDLIFDELDLDDLDLSEDSISSEDSEPGWLAEERRRLF
ncbi:MAG: hypothetical protein ROO71_09970 [Balneola sp.]